MRRAGTGGGGSAAGPLLDDRARARARWGEGGGRGPRGRDGAFETADGEGGWQVGRQIRRGGLRSDAITFLSGLNFCRGSRRDRPLGIARRPNLRPRESDAAARAARGARRRRARGLTPRLSLHRFRLLPPLPTTASPSPPTPLPRLAVPAPRRADPRATIARHGRTPRTHLGTCGRRLSFACPKPLGSLTLEDPFGPLARLAPLLPLPPPPTPLRAPRPSSFPAQISARLCPALGPCPRAVPSKSQGETQRPFASSRLPWFCGCPPAAVGPSSEAWRGSVATGADPSGVAGSPWAPRRARSPPRVFLSSACAVILVIVRAC